jgi:PTS system nitrogen regulatory IIA component
MTMDLGDLLAADGVIPALKAKTKKQALQELATKASTVTGISTHEIFEGMLQRERLGSTGFGRGIAIPHVKFKGLKSIVCLFARLEKPIDFESLDGEPVDLVFLLLAPEHAAGDHLKALHRISRIVREPALLESLRSATSLADLRTILTQPATSHAA